MPRMIWLVLRLAVCVGAATWVFVGGLDWVVLPGRALLELVGARGPAIGRWAVFLSGLVYGSSALVSGVARERLPEAPVVLDLLS